MAKQEWTGVYRRDEAGEPVALFRDGRHANDFRHVVLGEPDAVLATAELSVPTHEDVKRMIESERATEPPTGSQAAEDVERAAIRTRILEQERIEQIEREVRDELAAERKEPRRVQEPKAPGDGA